MRQARHGMTAALGVGVAVVALLMAACADSSGAGGSGGEAEPTSSATSPTPDASPTEEPSASPSLPEGGLPSFDEVAVVAGASGRGLPAGVDGTMESPAGVGWSTEAGLLNVVTYGSSSCPTIAEADATGDGQKVVVALVPPAANAICTMDYVPTTTVVAAPDGTDSAAPVTVTLGDLGAVEVLPPAADGEAGKMAWVTPS